MNATEIYPTWADAKHAAREISLEGFAWIVWLGPAGRYAVVGSECVDDAPPHYAAEFKEGVEQ